MIDEIKRAVHDAAGSDQKIGKSSLIPVCFVAV
jgi:hypothetical protein